MPRTVTEGGQNRRFADSPPVCQSFSLRESSVNWRGRKVEYIYCFGSGGHFAYCSYATWFEFSIRCPSAFVVVCQVKKALTWKSFLSFAWRRAWPIGLFQGQSSGRVCDIQVTARSWRGQGIWKQGTTSYYGTNFFSNEVLLEENIPMKKRRIPSLQDSQWSKSRRLKKVKSEGVCLFHRFVLSF